MNRTDWSIVLTGAVIVVLLVCFMLAVMGDDQRNYANPDAYHDFGQAHLATKVGDLHQEIHVLETAVAKQGNGGR